MFQVTVVATQRVVFPGETHALPVHGTHREAFGIGRRIVSVCFGRGSDPSVGALASIEAKSRLGRDAVVLTVHGEQRVALEPIAPEHTLETRVVAGIATAAEVEGEGAAEARSVGVAAANRYRATLAELGHAADVLGEVPEDPIDASYRLASLLRISEPERQHLLESETAAKRLRLLATVFERERALLEATISAGGH